MDSQTTIHTDHHKHHFCDVIPLRDWSQNRSLAALIQYQSLLYFIPQTRMDKSTGVIYDKLCSIILKCNQTVFSF